MRPSWAARGLAAWCVGAALSAPAGAVEGPYAAVTTRIAVRLTDRLSSQEAHAGDAFGFETTSSVAVDGFFLGAGTRGRGVVVAVRAARGRRPGELRLAARTLALADGRTVAVGLEPGQLARRLTGDVRVFTVPFGGVPVSVGSASQTNVVFERGTPFFVVAPPPPEPEATAASGTAG
ncbi:MAG: hypothetical protein NVSMB19_17320 [Vulcanimicrobiaceae bacterium]